MFWERVKGAFRQTPWTMSLISGVLVVWLLNFFGISLPMALLGGELDVAHAWRWVTYPLATPSVALWLFIGMYCFWLFAGSVERSLGTLGFGRMFVIVTILCAVANWLGTAAVTRNPQTSIQAWGVGIPATAIFMIWASLNRNSTILVMFVIPVLAKYLALATIVLAFLSPLGPLYGLPFALLFAGCWKWAENRGAFVPRPAAASSPRRGLSQWWSERKRAKRKGRFQVLEGGSPIASPPRVGSLQSLKKTPPSKVEEPSEKELDRILDKIRFEGMNTLTESERATLDSQSRRLRGDQ